MYEKAVRMTMALASISILKKKSRRSEVIVILVTPSLTLFLLYINEKMIFSLLYNCLIQILWVSLFILFFII
jgi:hypothetical protein